jgi:hypothetical protein
MNYEAAKHLFLSAKNQEAGKPYGNNTRIVQADIGFAVKLHDTNVVTFNPDGTIILNTGGYQTKTTKDRMNDAIREHGLNITQSKGMWYITDGENTQLFQDYLEIRNYKLDPKADISSFEGYKKKVDKLVSKYIKGFLDHIEKHGLEDPGPGDCWPCCMKDVNHASLDPMGIDHYLDHFAENYYVPSLLQNAVVQKGYGDPSLIWSMMKRDPSFRRREGQLVLQKFFRVRKTELAKLLMRRDSGNDTSV